MADFLFVHGLWMAESDKEAAIVNLFLFKYWPSSSTPLSHRYGVVSQVLEVFPTGSLDFSTQLKFLFPCLDLVSHAEWGL